VEGHWDKRTHSEGTPELMVASKTCAGGVTSRNSYRTMAALGREPRGRSWGENGDG